MASRPSRRSRVVRLAVSTSMFLLLKEDPRRQLLSVGPYSACHLLHVISYRRRYNTRYLRLRWRICCVDWVDPWV